MNYLEWLKKQKFELETTHPYADSTVVWVREVSYGAPACKVNGKLKVYITKVADDCFSMNVRGKGNNFWTAIDAYDITEADLVSKGRAIEHRLVAAWMEMVS